MPTPERTSLDAIVRAAAEILEEEGLAGVTMQAVAQRVGVRAPSLYKRVEGRDTLLRLVAEATLGELAARVEPIEDAAELAGAFRAFGRERPAAFLLVMAPAPGTPVARQEFRDAASASVLRVAAGLAGQEHALEAARTLTAWATGFIGMEINGAFTLGGDVESAWRFGLTRVVAALQLAAPESAEVSAPTPRPRGSADGSPRSR
ncbi:TetR family transcriptional regulator [Rathayibacter sp. PhB93]|uniref:TetR/AcrR family transcriptional regulator n=1 Tax=unclassified Rathayibacter TaxID=2609250 RepID=UPI000F482671|nr:MULTISPECIES: TetR/AcrR family transcriptional regulator [unclassified Rathayibacter]ROQ15510.1 TetR family transcriptional regulator [Rathayibacter sp. PhB93]TDQ15448.1 TetR family transcriptional regulator [Rathayibacter sp. PhB1]